MKKTIVLFGLLVAVNCIWDVFLFLSPDKETIFHYLFNIGYGLIFLFGAGVAISNHKKYPFSTDLGKSFCFYALSFLFYMIGLSIWAYYNVIVQTSLPYPSLSDLFFILFQPFSALGFIFLVRSFGSTFSLQRIIEGALLFGVIFMILYSFLAPNSFGADITLLARILNILYPLQDAFLIALVVVGLRTEKGVLHPNLLIFAFAALAMAIADTAFSYRTSLDIYWNGDVSDLIYLVAATLFSLGVIMTTRHNNTEHDAKFMTTASPNTLK